MTIKLLIAIFMLLIAAQDSMAKEWRGIVPLKSTRADVERRFGKPDKWGDNQVDDERVSFRYSEGGPCTDLYRALGKDNCYCSLEDDTVVSISVEPTVERKASDLKLDMTKFTKTPINPFPHTFEYSNRTEGVNYEVDEEDDRVRNIEYYAATVDCENIIQSRAPKYRNSWRGLVPLHATRRDVERLLGSPQRTWETNAAHETDHETLIIKYAKGGCGVGDTEWNVPRDTVVEFEVGQRFSFLLSQLNLDPSRWERQEIFPFPEINNPPKVANYSNQADGVSIRARSKGGGEEVVVSITYRPARIDEKLRCHGRAPFPGKKPVAAGWDSGRMFDKYGSLPLKEEKNHLDNLAVQLKKEPRSKGYVVVYDGSEDQVDDLKARACRALRRLAIQDHVDPKQLVAVTIAGGHREEFTVELWMWPIEASDDLPRFQPGVNKEEVSIIKGSESTTRCRKRS